MNNVAHISKEELEQAITVEKTSILMHRLILERFLKRLADMDGFDIAHSKLRKGFEDIATLPDWSIKYFIDNGIFHEAYPGVEDSMVYTCSLPNRNQIMRMVEEMKSKAGLDYKETGIYTLTAEGEYVIIRDCKVCENAFLSTTRAKKYCGDECRVNATRGDSYKADLFRGLKIKDIPSRRQQQQEDKKTKLFSFRIPKRMYDKLEKIANDKGITMSQLGRYMIAEDPGPIKVTRKGGKGFKLLWGLISIDW